MNQLDVRPGEGIGPIRLGMTRAEAIAAASEAGLAVHSFSRGTGPKTDLAIGGQLFVYFDQSGCVLEAEVGIRGDGDPRLIPVSCLGVPLAGPYDEVQRRMRALARVDESDHEYPGTSAYLELGLVLWADVKAEDLAETSVQAILFRRAEPYPVT